jgi:microcystin-dependent protein
MDFNELMGTIMLCTDPTTPENWADCDGRILNIVDDGALFSFIGPRFGGDGKTTFGLPKIPNVGTARYIICVNGTHPSRP